MIHTMVIADVLFQDTKIIPPHSPHPNFNIFSCFSNKQTKIKKRRQAHNSASIAPHKDRRTTELICLGLSRFSREGPAFGETRMAGHPLANWTCRQQSNRPRSQLQQHSTACVPRNYWSPSLYSQGHLFPSRPLTWPDLQYSFRPHFLPRTLSPSSRLR